MLNRYWNNIKLIYFITVNQYIYFLICTIMNQLNQLLNNKAENQNNYLNVAGI